jgi:hypothetical protein
MLDLATNDIRQEPSYAAQSDRDAAYVTSVAEETVRSTDN